MKLSLRVSLALALSLAAASCSSAPSKFTLSDAGPPPPAEDGSVTFPDATPPASAFSCSDDLHQVLDANGTVVKSCAANEGCNPNGTCVPACDAANANRSTIGCEYFNYSPDIIKAAEGACFAAVVANTWNAPVSLTVDYDGKKLDPSAFARLPSGNGKNLKYAPLTNGQIGPGEVAILFLAHWMDPSAPMNDVPCPIPAAVEGADAATHGTGIGKAFHVSTTAPVVAYDVFPYGGGNAAATSATLLLPVSAWDTNYLAMNAYPTSSDSQKNAGALPSLGVVAQEDGTVVTMKPIAPIAGGPGVAAASAGSSVKYTLNRGQVLQLTQAKELSGSPIQATKPIALFAGSTALNVADTVCCADSAHQQIPPVSALGSEYVGARYRDRNEGVPESVPYRIMGLVDGTKLTYSPTAPPNAPTTLKSGQVVEFSSDDAFTVSAQDDLHPIYLASYMTGCLTYGSANDCRGDAEFVNVVPAKQFMKSYVFFTDPTYSETSLVVVRTAGGSAVTLDCYGTLGGWQPAGTGYEYTRVDLVRHDFAPQGKCDNGRHEMTSSGTFGVTVWGWGSAETKGAYHIPQAPGFYTQAVSYAYPAGMRVKPINAVVVPAGPN